MFPTQKYHSCDYGVIGSKWYLNDPEKLAQTLNFMCFAAGARCLANTSVTVGFAWEFMTCLSCSRSLCLGYGHKTSRLQKPTKLRYLDPKLSPKTVCRVCSSDAIIMSLTTTALGNQKCQSMPVIDSIEMNCCIILPSFIAKHCIPIPAHKKTLKNVADIMTFSCAGPTSFGYCPVRYQQPVPVRTRITKCCWLAGQPMYPKSSGQLISSPSSSSSSSSSSDGKSCNQTSNHVLNECG